VRGCLLAGAVGDALGAPVEFDSLAAIRARYGPDGVTGLDRAYGVLGAVTDDTQMTLFTAEGLLRAMPGDEAAAVHRAYLRWLMTQGEVSSHPDFGDDLRSGWLIGDARLHHRRAPGMTCLAGLRSERMGTLAHRLNDSKGCGGVMRAAPVGLLAKSKDEAFRLGCETAAITHSHPSGYLASGALAVMTWAIVRDGAGLDAACGLADRMLEASGDAAGECLDALRAARALAAEGDPSAEKMESLGEAWVAEEALGMSVYAALVAEGDVRRGLLLAVNHSGDADSTGAIAGNLLGAWLGDRAIPESWRTGVEMADLIAHLADDVAGAIEGQPVDAARYPTP
jgi:ADP-ribosylglycohydrolase